MFCPKGRKGCFLSPQPAGYGIIKSLRRKLREQKDILVPCFGHVVVAAGVKEVDLEKEGAVGMGPGFWCVVASLP